jgi:hypothetical protein
VSRGYDPVASPRQEDALTSARPKTDSPAGTELPVRQRATGCASPELKKAVSSGSAALLRGFRSADVLFSGEPVGVSNAVYHATGKRIRELPITPEKVLV